MMSLAATTKKSIILICAILIASITLTYASSSTPTSITIRYIPAPKYEERATCSNNKQCGRSRFCDESDTCQRRLIDGSPCTIGSQLNCMSGICDAITKECSTLMLNLGSTCQNSDACLSGNCFHNKCRARGIIGAHCVKDTNCTSGLCDKKQSNKCIKPNQTPIHSIVPGTTIDLSNFRNLDPVKSSALYYTDSGVYDPAIANLFAAMHIESKFPVVILSHSSWIGGITCSNYTIEIPFTNKAAYKRVSRTWDRVGPFLIVTHTEGCAPSHKKDERTFWLVNGLIFDNAHRTVDANATQVALEEVVGHITLTFGASPSTPTTVPTIPSSSIISIPTSSISIPSASPSIVVPGSCTSNPAACTGGNFDRLLDDKLGYYDFDVDFTNSLKQFAPNLPNYDYTYYEGQLGIDPTLPRRDINVIIKRGLFGKIFKAVVKTVVKVTVAQVKFVVKNVVAPALKVVVKAIGKTPIGKLIDYVVSKWTPAVTGEIPMKWKPLKLFNSPWGMQTRFFNTKQGKSTTKDEKGADGKKTAALTKKKKPSAAASVSGSVSLFCVDCFIDGHFSYKGTLGFSLAEAKITKCTVDYAGKLEANVQIGLEAHATLEAEHRKELARIPLPGGFVLKDVVSVGPAMVFETSLGIKLDAEVDLLVGVGLHVPQFNTHLDLVDGSKSKQTDAGKPYFTSNISVEGALLARASFGIPMSLALGLDIFPLKVKKEVTLTMEPAILALAMTASDQDKFKEEGLEECDLGMAWKVGTGVSFALNLFDWSKYPLGKINGPNLDGGCIPIFTAADLIPLTCDVNKGVKWAVYNNAFSQFYSNNNYDFTYGTYIPESFKKAIPLDQGVTGVLAFATFGASPISYYGSAKKVTGQHYTINHVGYFLLPTDGIYTFNMNYVDDIVLLWINNIDVVKNYNRNNANVISIFGTPTRTLPGSKTISLILPANTLIPFRLMFGDSGGESHFRLDVTGPNGFNTAAFYSSLYSQSCDGTTAPPFVAFGQE